MAGYPPSEGEKKVAPEGLRQVVSAVFERCGMSGDDAGLLTDTLVVADLRGCHSHGVLRVPDYAKKLTVGGVNPQGRPRVVKDNGTALVIDGGNSMGQIGGVFAMRQAIERARSTNLAAAAVGGSNHCGAMAYFAMMALPEDMIGLATTNALPTMAPWGSRERILGINPLAAAVPAGEETPLVFDAAFSASAHGKIRVYQQKGLPIPGGWAFDKDGRPTTDAAEALAGLQQPIGGYKGTGLALIMGILSCLLSGASYGSELGNLAEGPKAGRDGHFFIALKVAAFADLAEFKQRVDGIIRQMRGSAKAPGVDRIYSPGELEMETERRYREEGIPLTAATLQGICETAEQAGVDASALGSPGQLT